MLRTFLVAMSPACLAAPALADHADTHRRGDAVIYGPACRGNDCWALVADETGTGQVIRARGYIRTLRLAEEAADALPKTELAPAACRMDRDVDV